MNANDYRSARRSSLSTLIVNLSLIMIAAGFIIIGYVVLHATLHLF